LSRIPAIERAWLRLSLIGLAGLALIASTGLGIEAAGASSGGIGASSGGTATQSGDDSASNNRSSALYNRLWERFRPAEKVWARETAECESGGNPTAIGGGGLYRGAFQFMRSTWKNSPKSPGGDPIVHPYRTQAVVAVMLKRRDGAGHWPVCG
jgi:hypothetical protein